MTSINTVNIQPLITEHEVASVTGLSVASVRRWRLLRQGPNYMKIGASVRYKPEDLAAWLESRPTGGEGVRKAQSMQTNEVQIKDAGAGLDCNRRNATGERRSDHVLSLAEIR